MFAIIKTEFLKIKRYHILLIGLIGMFCSPLLQLFSQMAMNEELRNPDYNFAALTDSVIWGNTQIFMPVLFTLTGGYLINRESTDDTLKNILTVPISFRKFLAGKLTAIGILSVLFGIYSLIVTLVVSFFAGLPGINAPDFFYGLLRVIPLSALIYIIVLPVITLCSRKPGLFMTGSMISFLAGYSVLFFKRGLLRHLYPFSAALTLIGFDTSSYTRAPEKGSLPLAILSLSFMLLAAVLLVCTSKVPEAAGKQKRAKKHASFRPAQREHLLRSARQ